MLCNIKSESNIFQEMARCEISVLQNTRVQIHAKNKQGKEITEWLQKDELTNFRYIAWYNGIKADFQTAKKLAKMGTIVYNATGQNLNLIGDFELQEVKRLLDQIKPCAEYYEKNDYRSR